MTVSAPTPTSIQVPGNGSATIFSFPQKVFAATDIIVGFIINSAYVLQIAGYQVSNIDINGSCTVTFTVPPPLGVIVDIRTCTPQTQNTDFANLGGYLPESTTDTCDRIVRMVQDLSRRTYDFGIHGPDTESIEWPALPDASDRAGGILVFGSDGTPGIGIPTTQVISQSILAQFLGLGQTALEAQLNITPVNTNIPPHTIDGIIRVDRYVTNLVPGTTDTTAGWNNVAALALVAGGEVSFDGSVPYLVTAPINFTWATNGGAPAITVRGTSATHNPNQSGGIKAIHNGTAVFDCTGNDTIQFVDVGINTPVPAVTFPKIGILLARNSTKGTLVNRIIRPRIAGYFGIACIYNYGSENSYLEGAYLANYNPATTTANYIITGGNIRSVTSPFVTIATGTLSCIVHDIIAPAFLNAGAGTNSDCLVIEQANDVHVVGGWLACFGRSFIYCDQTVAPSNLCTFYSVRGEVSGGQQQLYGICFGAASSVMVPSGWKIRDCQLTSSTNAIASIDSNTHIDGIIVDGITENASKGISFPGTVQGGSKFFTGSTLISIGTLSAGCVLLGSASAWTVTNANGLLIDTGTAPPAGFGTPTGNAIVSNFPGATATLLQTSQTVSEILSVMKARGLIVA